MKHAYRAVVNHFTASSRLLCRFNFVLTARAGSVGLVWFGLGLGYGEPTHTTQTEIHAATTYPSHTFCRSCAYFLKSRYHSRSNGGLGIIQSMCASWQPVIDRVPDVCLRTPNFLILPAGSYR